MKHEIDEYTASNAFKAAMADEMIAEIDANIIAELTEKIKVEDAAIAKVMTVTCDELTDL